MFGLTLRRLWPLVTVGGLLAALALAAVVATPGITAVPIIRPAESRAFASEAAIQRSAGLTAAATQRSQPAWHPAAWLSTVIGALCAAAGLAVAALLLWQLIKMWLADRAARLAAASPTGPVFATRREAVLAAVDASIAELAGSSGDARAAVIACWVRLEEVAAAAGTHREVGDTPANLVERLLSDHQVSARLLYALAEIYRAARYSTRVIESSMRTEAIDAFGRLHDELARSRSGPLADVPVVAAGSGAPAAPDGAPVAPRSGRPRPAAPSGGDR